MQEIYQYINLYEGQRNPLMKFTIHRLKYPELYIDRKHEKATTKLHDEAWFNSNAIDYATKQEWTNQYFAFIRAARELVVNNKQHIVQTVNGRVFLNSPEHIHFPAFNNYISIH